MDVWKSIQDHFSNGWSIFSTVLGLVISVISLYLTWRSIKMYLPGVKTRVRKDIIGSLQKYVAENTDVKASDIRSVINTICSEHNLSIGIISEYEVLQELRTSIIVSSFLDISQKQSMLEKLDIAENKISWTYVEMQITKLMGEVEKTETEIDLEHIKKTLFSIFSDHMEILDEFQSKKMDLMLTSYQKIKRLWLMLLCLFGLMVYLMLSGNPTGSTVDYWFVIIFFVFVILILSFAIDYSIKKAIVFLASTSLTKPEKEIKMPRLLQFFSRISDI